MVDKIKRNIIEDDAVTSAKIPNDAIKQSEFNKTAITGLTEVTSIADTDEMLILDASTNNIKRVDKSRLTNLDFPTFTSISPSNSQTVDGGNITFTITGTGFSVGSNARLISNTGVRTDFDTVVRASSTSITGTIARSSLLLAQSPYDVQVINGTGQSVVSQNAITVDNTPIFETAAGSLGTFTEGDAIDVTINARDPDSTSAVSFELQSGSLPAGLSLVNQSGDSCRITGTATGVSADTTSNFTIRAFDSASNTISRAFSMTINDFTLNSAKFDRGSSDYLTRTPSSTSNRRTFTKSVWFKSTTEAGGSSYIFSTGDYSGGDGYLQIVLSSSGRLTIDDYNQSADSYNMRYVTPSTGPLFRDPSAWYHLVLAVDTTQSSAGDRVKIYINGSNITSQFTKTTDTVQNDEFEVNLSGQVHQWGRSQNNDNYFDGYLAEINFIDGSALAPTSFGETDSNGVWVPINYSGSYGTNGYHLDFADAADLGDDESGNGNDFTEGNLTSIDKFEDTPINNYCTLNPLDDIAGSTYSHGNLKAVTVASGSPPHFTTIGLSSGKWYWEVKATSFTEHSDGYITIGITSNQGSSTTNQLGHLQNDYAYVNNGQLQAATGTDATYGNSYTQGQIIGVYMDLDNNKLYFAINGTIQDSGTGHSITAAASTTAGFYMPSFSDYSSSGSNLVTVEFNFGAGASFAISSGNTDANGYGNFEYSPNDGGASSFDGAAKNFYAINTKNLAQFG